MVCLQMQDLKIYLLTAQATNFSYNMLSLGPRYMYQPRYSLRAPSIQYINPTMVIHKMQSEMKFSSLPIVIDEMH